MTTDDAKETFPCDGCGRSTVKICLAHNGKRYCWKCYDGFVRSPCVRCGEQAVVRPDESEPICRSCNSILRREGVNCARCARPIGRLGKLLKDGTGHCKSCWRYFLPPKVCSYCGQTSRHVTRAFPTGLDKPACVKCRLNASSLINCAGCHRPRYPAGSRDDGRKYCKDCLPTGKPPLVECAMCGKLRPRYSKTLCEDCGWERIQKKLFLSLLSTITTPWAKELFEAFFRDSRVVARRRVHYPGFSKEAQFFAMLEKSFDGPESLSGVLIIRRLGQPIVRRHPRVMSFLARLGLINISDDPDYQLEWFLDRLRRIIPSDEGWISDLLQRFLNRLLRVRDKIPDRRRRTRVVARPKALESAIRSAHGFLVHARDRFDVAAAPGLTQEMLDLYLGSDKGKSMRIRPFVRYFNQHEKQFQRLKVFPAPRQFPYHLILPESKRHELIRTFCAAQSTAELRRSLICLFALVFGQAPATSTRMKASQVRATDDGLTIAFARVPVTLPQEIADVVLRWLDVRREISGFELTDSSAYLFPGKLATTHVGSEFLQEFCAGLGVSRRQLRASGIAALTQAGASQPKILTQVFGVSSITAIRYCEAFGRNKSARAAFVAKHYGR